VNQPGEMSRGHPKLRLNEETGCGRLQHKGYPKYDSLRYMRIEKKKTRIGEKGGK
jgi:hypothetical protein